MGVVLTVFCSIVLLYISVMRCRLIYRPIQFFQRLHDPINVFTYSQTPWDKIMFKATAVAIATADLAHVIKLANKTKVGQNNVLGTRRKKPRLRRDIGASRDRLETETSRPRPHT